MAGKRQVIDALPRDVDEPVGGQLSSVDRHPCSALVGHLHDGRKGDHLACHVGGAGNGEQGGRAFFQVPGQPFDRLGQRGGRGDAPVGVTLPGEQVGVVLDVQVDDLTAGGHGPDQQVEPVGSVPGEDDDVVAPGAHEPLHRGPGRLVERGADQGEVTGAAVDAGVPGKHLGDACRHLHEALCAGRVVKVDVAGLPPCTRGTAMSAPTRSARGRCPRATVTGAGVSAPPPSLRKSST